VRRFERLGLSAGVIVMTGLVCSSAAAQAAVPGPGWAISSLAEATNFAFADDGLCSGDIEGHEAFICDAYSVTVLNAGSEPSTGTIKLEDELPEGVEVDAPGGTPLIVARTLEESAQGGSKSKNVSCLSIGAPGEQAIECAYAKPVPAGSGLNVEIHVLVRGAKPETAINYAKVEGGGAAPAATEAANTLNGEAPAFGFQDFHIGVYEADGAIDTRAGDHPSSLTATLDLTSALDPHGSFLTPDLAVEEPKTVTLELPLGLLANPQAAAQCPEADLTQSGEPACPVESRVGMVAIDQRGELVSSLEGRASKLSYIYNMVPEPGFPAEFAFKVASAGVFMYASVVPGASGYGLHITVPDIPRAIVAADGISITFFGDPGERDGDSGASPAFLTNPTACSDEPLGASVEADSWVQPQRWVSTPAAQVVYPKIEGCDVLQFDPTIAVKPETTQADTPSGYEIDVQIPQAQDLPDLPATPQLKDATVTLPAGVSLSPPAAAGLEGCAPTGREGINIEGAEATELGEGSRDGSFYEDGVAHARAGHCPPSSIVGEVEIETPLLPRALRGHVFLAQPRCGGEGRPPCSEADAEAGRMLGLYLEAESSGVNIKLAGSVEVGGHSAQNGLLPGQLRARFRDAPRLPFSALKLRLEHGSMMLLANPQTCGSFQGRSELVPWSTPETPTATPSSSFAVTGCGASMPFAPSFSVGTLTAIAGASSPFTLALARSDGEQALSKISVSTPPGLLAMLSGVPPCGEPRAAIGTCAQASEIGTATVASGSGEDPLWLTGHVYLTTGYRDEPFGLEIVVPAAVGPFELAGTTGSGTVLVRASIAVDPHTAALTIASDPLPQIVDGVPLRLRTVDLDIDRSGFVLNPTSCNPQQITGTISGALPDGTPGTTVPVSSPFALAGCRGLRFKPKLTALTHALRSKAGGAYLHVKIVSGPTHPGQANIAKLKVDLPKRLPSRLSTLRKACPAAVFEANPAGCPAASVVGEATAVTPVLETPLRGPAYLVSHGGVAFPALEIVLQGEGVVLELDGQTKIEQGITSSTFSSLPDAPIRMFDLVLPTGPHSLLGASGNLCKQTLEMPTALVGQNGAVIHTRTSIAVSGCPRRRAGSPHALIH